MIEEPDLKDVRCLCGSLMARFSEKGLELKCKRCKRVHLIPFSDVTIDPALLDRSGPFRKPFPASCDQAL